MAAVSSRSGSWSSTVGAGWSSRCPTGCWNDPVVRLDVFTIFPVLIEAVGSESLVGRARQSGLFDLRIHDLRSAATDPRRSVDDSPFGGGAGMVLAPGPVFGAVEAAAPPRPLFLLGPGGRRLDQAL